MSGNPAPETWSLHFSGDPRSGGVPTEARFVGTHATCLAQGFRAPILAKPSAFLLMGPPASGKTSMLVPLLAAKGLQPGHTIDPDEYKKNIPEFPNAGASAVHEESSWIAEQARRVALGRSCSFVNDAVGAEPSKYAALMQRLIANGYQVQLICAYVESLQELLERVAARFIATGRAVPPDFVRDAHAKIPKSFARLCHYADAAYLFDGASTTSAANRLVWERVSGQVRVHNPNFVGRLGVSLPT